MAKKALKNIQERCAGLFKGIAHNSILVYQNYDSAMNNINRIMKVENEKPENEKPKDVNQVKTQSKPKNV